MSLHCWGRRLFGASKSFVWFVIFADIVDEVSLGGMVEVLVAGASGGGLELVVSLVDGDARCCSVGCWGR